LFYRSSFAPALLLPGYDVAALGWQGLQSSAPAQAIKPVAQRWRLALEPSEANPASFECPCRQTVRSGESHWRRVESKGAGDRFSLHSRARPRLWPGYPTKMSICCSRLRFERPLPVNRTNCPDAQSGRHGDAGCLQTFDRVLNAVVEQMPAQAFTQQLCNLLQVKTGFAFAGKPREPRLQFVNIAERLLLCFL
jgi:hypothetical protein